MTDTEGISLVAVHININEEFDGLDAGHIAKDIRKDKNGYWTYKNKHTVLKKGDVIYYWIHTIYNGLGYDLLDQEYLVTGNLFFLRNFTDCF